MSCGCETGRMHRWKRDFANLRQQWSDFTLKQVEDDESCCYGPCCRPRSRSRATPKSCSCSCCPKQTTGCRSTPTPAKGTFGLAWVAQTPLNKYCDPCGWQVEIIDTPSRIENKCLEIIEWVNCPPLGEERGGGCKKPCCCKRPEQQLCDCCLGDCNCIKCQRIPIKIEQCPCKRRICPKRVFRKCCCENEDCCKCSNHLETNQNNRWPISESCACDEDIKEKFKMTDKDTSYHEQDILKGGQHQSRYDKEEQDKKYPKGRSTRSSSEGDDEAETETEKEDLTKEKKDLTKETDKKEDLTKENDKKEDKKIIETGEEKKPIRRFQRSTRRAYRERIRNKKGEEGDKIIENKEEKEIKVHKRESEEDDDKLIKEKNETEQHQKEQDAKAKPTEEKTVSRSSERRRRRRRQQSAQKQKQEPKDKDDEQNKTNSSGTNNNNNENNNKQENKKEEEHKPQKQDEKKETNRGRYKRSSSTSQTVKNNIEKPKDIRKTKSTNVGKFKEADDEDLD